MLNAISLNKLPMVSFYSISIVWFCIRIDGFNMTKLKVLTRINMFTLEYDYNECADRNNDN